MKRKVLPLNFNEMLDNESNNARTNHAGTLVISRLITEAYSYLSIHEDMTRSLLNRNLSCTLAQASLKSAIAKMDKVYVDKTQAQMSLISLRNEVNPQRTAQSFARKAETVRLYSLIAHNEATPVELTVSDEIEVE